MKNLKKLSILAVSLIMVFSFSGCKSIDGSKNSSEEETSSKTYGDFENGIFSTEEFTVELGEDWYKSDSTSNSETAVFTKGSKSNSYSSINIRCENRSSEREIDVDQYRKDAVKQYGLMDDYTVTKSKKVKIDGRDAFKLYINMETNTQKLKIIQCYIIDKTNVFTFSYLTSSDEYKDSKNQAEKILKTFKFK